MDIPCGGSALRLGVRVTVGIKLGLGLVRAWVRVRIAIGNRTSASNYAKFPRFSGTYHKCDHQSCYQNWEPH